MKRFKKVFKIPTLFALTLIAIALGLGLTVDYFNSKQQNALKTVYSPKKLAVVNLSDSGAAVAWQTSVPATGIIIFGTDQKLIQTAKDLRDNTSQTATPTLSHFIPISKLAPNTTYYYQVKSQNLTFPNNPLTFKTSPTIQSDTPINSPLMGSVVTPDLKPLTDALVFLDIPGASQLATVTTTGGNFILPLKDLRTQDLSRSFDINTETQAQVVIIQGTNSSRNQIKLPPVEAALRSLVLGQDLDLRSFQPPPPPSSSTIIATKNIYDLNDDGKINALDLSEVTQSIGKLSLNSRADLNDDGKVDQKDLDLIRKEAQ